MSPSEVPNVDLLNGIYSLFLDNINCAQNWGFYLFSPEFDDEPELRNKLGVIWLCSLLDSLDGERRSLQKYRIESERRGLSHFRYFCDQAGHFIRTVEEVLASYTREEQLFITDHRDQLVHSWLGRRHVEHFTVRHFDGKDVIRERLALMEHADLVRPFYDSGSLDGVLYQLLLRFRNLELRYWHVIGELAAGRRIDALQRAMMEGRELRISALHDPIQGAARFAFPPARRSS